MVSIIMPVHDRFALTYQAIETLTKNPGFDDFELIIVDDCSSEDRVREYLDSLAYRTIFMRAQTHHGACCNAGASVASGEYLYFTDNDIFFTDGWLGTLMNAAVAFPEIGVLGGDRHPWHQIDQIIVRDGIEVETSWTQVGYSQLIHRDLWRKVGPFSHDPLHVYGSDDRELCDRVISLGYKVGSVAPRVIYHCGITKTDGSEARGAELFKEQEGPDRILA